MQFTIFLHVADPKDCKFGGDDCCTEDKPCKEDEGDCDNDDECAGNLKCGSDNCIGDAFEHTDDCCIGKKTNIYLESKMQLLADKIKIINYVTCDNSVTFTANLIIFQTQIVVSLEVMTVAQKTNHAKKMKEIVMVTISVLET